MIENVANSVRDILIALGLDPERDGLKETPQRVARMYGELLNGYQVDVSKLLKTFEDKCDEMVVVRDIGFFSLCEHHLMPFFGKAHIAYLPRGRVVGLSKLGRLVDAFARRLQVQERMTEQITEAMEMHLKPNGSACVIEARHLCMMARGVQKQNAVMVTSSLKGEFFNKPEARAEFLNLVRSPSSL